MPASGRDAGDDRLLVSLGAFDGRLAERHLDRRIAAGCRRDRRLGRRGEANLAAADADHQLGGLDARAHADHLASLQLGHRRAELHEGVRLDLQRPPGAEIDRRLARGPRLQTATHPEVVPLLGGRGVWSLRDPHVPLERDDAGDPVGRDAGLLLTTPPAFGEEDDQQQRCHDGPGQDRLPGEPTSTVGHSHT